MLEALRTKNQNLRQALKRSLLLLGRVNASLLEATDEASPCDLAKNWKRTFLEADRWVTRTTREFLMEDDR